VADSLQVEINDLPDPDLNCHPLSTLCPLIDIQVLEV
jgi:hypothetical protein